MVSEVKIEIDRSSTGGTFTNYDVIRGNITLVVTSSLSLNYIQAKLEGISKSQVSVPRENLISERNNNKSNRRKDRRGSKDNREKDKIISDTHKVLYDTSIVFPPDNVRQVSNAKEFTLTPGNYTYPFEFKIPLNNSCAKIQGVTNKLSFNKKTFDLTINNGNFNSSVIRNTAKQYLDGSGNQNGNGQFQEGNYHCTTQLPPSLSGMGDTANIRYFIKVTCKRSSFIKTNLRSFDPFIFLPLDLDSRGQPINHRNAFEDELREVFYRKDLVFRNRIPEIVAVKVPSSKSSSSRSLPTQAPPPKRGFFDKLFDNSPSYPLSNNNSSSSYSRSNRINVSTSDVSFGFEVRFRHPAFLIPTKAPSFKLYLVSNVNPSKYSLGQYGRPDESNGLGVVYLQNLRVDLTCITMVSALESDGSYKEIHRSRHDKVIPICDNTYHNLEFDLKDSIRQRSSSATSTSDGMHSSYELEIPKRFYANCTLPDHVSPSFTTCNVSRKYSLTITGGFSSEKVNAKSDADVAQKVMFVDLLCQNVKVLSGLNMTQFLHSSANNSKISQGLESSKQSSSSPVSSPVALAPGAANSSAAPPYIPTSNTPPSDTKDPPLPERPAGSSLPTYDDVIMESSYQDDSEHIQARRRYQQHEQYYTNMDFE